MCVQRKAEKKISSEEDIIQANKLAFNDDIGIVTNHVTSMFEVQAGFNPDTPEYETLSYRIMCGQLYQQNVIDRAKGIVAKPMPSYWYSVRDNMIKDGDSNEIMQFKAFNRKIAAVNKPYFMTYVYPSLRTKNNTYVKNSNYGVAMRFATQGIFNIDELRAYEPKTQEMIDYLDYHEKFTPVGHNPCIVNRVCKICEEAFDSCKISASDSPDFDYSILKNNISYSPNTYSSVLAVYQDYQKRMSVFMERKRTEKLDPNTLFYERERFAKYFKMRCEEICTNEKELCNIVLDICYQTEKSKQFAWDICGDVILNNLLENNNNMICFPKMVEGNGDFEYCGKQFTMCEQII